MKWLIKTRTRIEEFYLAHRRVVNYILRLVLLFLSFLLVSGQIGFQPLLSNVWFIFAISVLLAFIPTRFVMIPVLIYTIIQVVTLSYGLGVVVAVILVIMYLLYFRFASQYGFLLMVLPLLFIVKGQLLAVLLLAVIAPATSVFAVAFGTVFYHLLHYLNTHAVVFASTTGTAEFEKAETLLKGVFSNPEFLSTLVVLIVVFLAVHFIKRANFSHSYEISIAIGTGFYIVLKLLCDLIFGTITTERLVIFCISGLVCGALAILLQYSLKALDYTRTETVEFEDDEYNYYVKAVPKTAFKTETVNVKRINKRKTR